MERAYVKNGGPESIRRKQRAKSIDARRNDFLTRWREATILDALFRSIRSAPRKRHSMRIHPLDLAIVIAYLLGVTALGMRFRRGQQNATDYFLGGRTAPWWALAFSIVATETSTLTIIGGPAISYAGNLTFLQLVFGYLIGRVLIVLLLLPGYFRGEFFTAYALIEKRFGEKMRAVAASTFLITRAIAEGVRVSAIALVVSVVLGTSEKF